MLPRIHRLHKKTDIELLAKTGQRRMSVFFVVKRRPNTQKHSRWVIIVSTKVHKKAVYRNRIRRQVAEIIRTKLLADSQPFDYMVIVKQQALTASYVDLMSDLCGIFYPKH